MGGTQLQSVHLDASMTILKLLAPKSELVHLAIRVLLAHTKLSKPNHPFHANKRRMCRTAPLADGGIKISYSMFNENDTHPPTQGVSDW